MLEKLKSLFRKKKDNSISRIVGVRGEVIPGYVRVDIEDFMPDGTPQDKPTVTEDFKISPKMRATVNRILAGLETEEDLEIFTMFILG